MYCTGGLEPSGDDSKTLDIDGVTYVVSDRFKSMLRDSFIDWGTFLEIYNDNLTYTLMFDQMIKLLNIKENENLREFMIPLVKKIYHLPASAHMACMVKQFMVYEPLSVVIHGLFTTIKIHFEYIVDKFLNARNNYITINNLKDKPNDITALKKYWENMDQQYNINSSSVMLLFLHPPNGLKSKLNFNITGLENVIMPLKDAVRKFNYIGFCPKVPQDRLKAILSFPINNFITAIKAIDSDAKFPNYKMLEKFIADELKKMPPPPNVEDNYERKTAPKEMSDNLELTKWYVDEILNLRKTLVKYGTDYETYYTEQATIFIKINDVLKKEFLHKH
jgi:hypothetical protein